MLEGQFWGFKYTDWRLYDKGMAEMEKAKRYAANHWDIWGQMAVSDAMPCTPYAHGTKGRKADW